MKRSLDLDTLAVQTFSPEPPPPVDADGLFAPSSIDFTACHTDCRCLPTP